MNRFLGMPVARRENRQPGFFEFLDVCVPPRHNFGAAGHPEPSAGAEIVLHVDDQERILAFHHFRLYGRWRTCKKSYRLSTISFQLEEICVLFFDADSSTTENYD